MAESMDTSSDPIDFKKIVSEYAKMKKDELNNAQNKEAGFICKVPNAEEMTFKLKNVELQVFEPKWIEIKENTLQGLRRQVQVKSNNDGTYGQVHTEQKMDLQTTIEIQQGLCTGLDARFQLAMPEKLKEKLGEALLVDPANGKNEIKKEMKVAVLSGQEHVEKDATATAKITSSEAEYKGTFTCKLCPKGAVPLTTFRGGVKTVKPEDIQQMIEYLQDKDSPLVGPFEPHMYNGEKKWVWKMEGYGLMKWDFDSQIEWTKTGN